MRTPLVLVICLNDSDHGLGTDVLDACDVLIWWGHQRQKEVSASVGQDIVRRIKSGRLSLKEVLR